MSAFDEQRFSVVVPTVGRPSLERLIDSLAASLALADRAALDLHELVVVDDRPDLDAPALTVPRLEFAAVRVVRTGGRGPAAARNAGWRASSAPWVVFLDDDVELPLPWADELTADLDACGPSVGGSQGRLRVPLPPDRSPTDWERGTAGLQDAAWATADMAYRRELLVAVSGFDERFPRAYREDADLAIRAQRIGWRLERGTRTTVHPVRPADDWVSLRVQRGNADDVLMRSLHGSTWRLAGQVPSGRFSRHALTTAAGIGSLVALALGRRRVAAASGLAWLALSGEFLAARLRPGPRPGDPGFAAEARRMALTSLTIPPAAVVHRVRGEWRHRAGAAPWPPPPRAVLFDRDGTLVHDVPYNGDPAQVRPVDGAREALDALRAAGLRIGMVSNQSGIARGLITAEQVDAVNARVAELLGPFGTVQICPHGTDDGCSCRKPAGGMVLAAARELGVEPYECVVIGDIGADVGAARAAGARPVLVPTPQTRLEEVAEAPETATDLRSAVDLVLAAARPVRGAR